MANSLGQVWPDGATSLRAQVLCAFRCHGSAKPTWEEGDASRRCFGDTSGASGLAEHADSGLFDDNGCSNKEESAAFPGLQGRLISGVLARKELRVVVQQKPVWTRSS